MVSVNTSDKASDGPVPDNQVMVQNGSSEPQGVSRGGLDTIPNQASSAVRRLNDEIDNIRAEVSEAMTK